MRVDPRSTGKRIAARRKELGLSQRDVQSAGVSYAYISRIEAGARRPSLSALIELAAKLDVTALYLLTGRADARCPFCGRGI